MLALHAYYKGFKKHNPRFNINLKLLKMVLLKIDFQVVIHYDSA